MDEIQQDYRQQLNAILKLKSSTKVKKSLLENLINSIKFVQDMSKDSDYGKCRGNYEVLSTCISDCYNSNFQMQKDIEELEQKIIKMRMVKFQNNEDVQTMEEELFQMQKIVKTRMQYNDFLKKKIDSRMEGIQKVQDDKSSRVKSKSVLNKSLDTVAGILKLSKWWD